MATYFVTGATGFIGTSLVQQLVEANDDVVALVRDPETAALPAEVELHTGDVTQKQSMREPMTGVDGLFHLAGWYRIGVNDPETAHAVNVEGTRNVLELMDELDIPRGVYTSTLAVNSDTDGAVADESYRFDGQHGSLYDRTKWVAHYDVAVPMIDDGLPLIIVQPGGVYGPEDPGPTGVLWDAYRRGDIPMIPKRTGICLGHVEDTARAIRLAMGCGRPGRSYIIAGPPYTLEEIFAIADQVTGHGVPPSVSPRFFRYLSRIVSPIENLLSLPSMYSSEMLWFLGGVTYWGDNSRAQEELGITHRPLQEGLEDVFVQGSRPSD